MKITEFVSCCKIARNTKQAEQFLNDYLKSFGIYSYAFTYYSRHIKTGSKLHYHCVSKPLKRWHLHYLEQQYADVDRTLDEYHQMTLPFFWDVKEQPNKQKISVSYASV